MLYKLIILLMTRYYLLEVESKVPTLLSHWRAHTTPIKCIELISLEMELSLLEFVLTTSDDCSLRIWTGNVNTRAYPRILTFMSLL